MAPKSRQARGKNIQPAATKPTGKKDESCWFSATIPAGHLASGGHRKKLMSRSIKAGLQFPVGPIERYLKEGRYSKRIGRGAPVYLAVVLEYLDTEVLEIAGNTTKYNKKSCISSRHLMFTFRAMRTSLSCWTASQLRKAAWCPISTPRSPARTPLRRPPRQPRRLTSPPSCSISLCSALVA